MTTPQCTRRSHSSRCYSCSSSCSSLSKTFPSDDIDDDSVEASGWNFENIHVLNLADFKRLTREGLKAISSANESEQIPTSKLTQTPAQTAKRGGGRTSLYPRAKITFDLLFTDKPHLEDQSAAKILHDFNAVFRRQFHPDNKDFAPMSERSIRKHLKHYRQELAEIDKN